MDKVGHFRRSGAPPDFALQAQRQSVCAERLN